MVAFDLFPPAATETNIICNSKTALQREILDFFFFFQKENNVNRNLRWYHVNKENHQCYRREKATNIRKLEKTPSRHFRKVI